jgi:RNA polymerase sigma-70 factor (ECF subfamily)
MTDVELLNSFRNGDTSVFEHLIRRYQSMVFTVSLSLVKNREDAEDITQEVLVKVYHALKGFKGKSSLKTWIYRITYNKCMDELSRRNRSIAFDENLGGEEEQEVPAFDLMGEQEGDRKARIQVVKEALEELKPLESMVLTLYYLKEQNINEIAEITSLKSTHIRVLMSRGRKNLYQKASTKLKAYG